MPNKKTGKKLANVVNRTKKHTPLKSRPRPTHPIKMIIPPWIDKKYIKNGRVDWEEYSK